MRDPATSVKRYYQEAGHARGYDDVRFANAGGQFVDAWEKEIVGSFVRDHPADQPILEVAAGTGRFSLALARQGYTVTAVDSSAEMLDQIRETAEAEGLTITCVEADVFNLPFADGAFDTVFSLRFVWHFKNVTSIVTELSRVSRRHVVFDLMNRNSLAALTAPIANHVFYRSLHTELTTRGEALGVLKSAGLALVQSEQAFAFPYIFYRRLPVLSRALHVVDRALLKCLPVGSVFYFKARKNPSIQP